MSNFIAYASWIKTGFVGIPHLTKCTQHFLASILSMLDSEMEVPRLPNEVLVWLNMDLLQYCSFNGTLKE